MKRITPLGYALVTLAYWWCALTILGLISVMFHCRSYGDDACWETSGPILWGGLCLGAVGYVFVIRRLRNKGKD